MDDEASLFKVLDSTRLRLVALLAVHGEICVCKLANALAEPDFKVSRHLRVLRAAGVVHTRRDGTWVHYLLVEPRIRLEECLQNCFRDCLSDHATVVADVERLKDATCSNDKENCEIG